MPLPFGKGSKLVLAVALVFTFVIVLHLSSFPTLAEWKLPTLSSSSWNTPTTSDPPEQLPSVDDKVKWEPIEHDPLLVDDPLPASSALYASTSASTSTPPPAASSTKAPVPNGAGDSEGPPCRSLPGGEDVLVVMRTGATETKDKLPVHLDTTFQCYPNLVIFSDFAENFRGRQQIHDVLENIPNKTKNSNDQFKHYWHIQEAGRKGLDVAELSGAVSLETGDGTGKGGNPGWELDKWKFVPMINETLALYPDKKWYVFVEPDSYLVWSNFLQWIPNLDPDRSAYYGSEVMAGDTVFAHGGSVFLLTRPAMEKVANAFNSKTEEILSYIGHSYFGDAILAKILKDEGVPVTHTWPHFQGGNPAYTLDWEGTKGKKSLWCAPALSYHHLVPVEIEELFQFEQGWIDDVQTRLVDRSPPLWSSDVQTLLHHKDTFKLYIQPNLTKERDDWDAVSDGPDPPALDTDIAGCRAICEADPECMQYTLGPSGCTIKTDGPRGPRMGQRKKGYTSGWLVDRVDEWVEKLDQCSALSLDWLTY